jgi:hypothetical protein
VVSVKVGEFEAIVRHSDPLSWAYPAKITPPPWALHSAWRWARDQYVGISVSRPGAVRRVAVRRYQVIVSGPGGALNCLDRDGHAIRRRTCVRGARRTIQSLFGRMERLGNAVSTNRRGGGGGLRARNGRRVGSDGSGQHLSLEEGDRSPPQRSARSHGDGLISPGLWAGSIGIAPGPMPRPGRLPKASASREQQPLRSFGGTVVRPGQRNARCAAT